MAQLIGTAGHVDHGKTSLIRALTGIDADRLPEEKRRGLTIDVGFAYIDLPSVGRVSIVDVPGHEKFVGNMLVGALGMDVVLLCVAADESVKPQTVEHFQILELLPVERMVVALTRCDLAGEDARAVAREEVRELLAPTRFAGSPIIETSATTGAGLEELKRALAAALAGDEGADGRGWFLPIDRAFTVKGHGVVVTGTLSQGSVCEGDAAVVLPEGIEARVRSIESHDVAVEEGKRGSRTALNLTGVKAQEIRRGQIVASPGIAFATRALDGEVRWLQEPKHGARVRVSIGADEAIAKAFLNDHDKSLVQIRFEREVAAAKGQPFIVRRYSPPALLGGGRVVVPVAKQRRKSESPGSGPKGESDEDAIVAAVARTEHGLENDELCRLLGRSPQALGDVLERLKTGGRLLGFAGLWTTPEQFAKGAQAYLDALAEIHEQEPTKLAQPKDAPLKGARLPWSGKPLDRIVARMVEEGRLRAMGAGVALAEFRVKFSDRQRAMLDRVMAELGKNGLSAPSLDEVTKALKVPPQAVEETVRLGLASGEIVRVAEGYYLPLDSVQQATDTTRQKFQGRQFTASEFREAFVTTRKYAIPFLEHLDSKGVTKRFGDSRVVV